MDSALWELGMKYKKYLLGRSLPRDVCVTSGQCPAVRSPGLHVSSAHGESGVTGVYLQ